MKEPGLSTHKLRALLTHADKNNTWYEVYSSNVEKNSCFWEWVALTEGVIQALLTDQIVVSNFRPSGHVYMDLTPPKPIPRHKSVTIIQARRTGKNYNHINPIDLHKY